MKNLKFFLAVFFLLFFVAHRALASDINDIVYPPPEPERIVTEDKGVGSIPENRPGITDEVQDKDKMDKIYVYPDGRVLVPGTTPFEPVDAGKKRRNSSNHDEGHSNYHNHHARPDYQIEPVLSEKKGRVKSKLGITGPGYVIVPAREHNGTGK